MNDIKPHRHGDEGEGSTHSCCNARLKAEGGKARCCYCVPHEDCGLTQRGAVSKLEDNGDE